MNEFRHINTSVGSKLFKSQTIVFYGCEFFNLDGSYMNKLMTTWRVCARKVLKVHRQTNCNIISPIIKCKDLLLLIEQRILSKYLCQGHPE